MIRPLRQRHRRTVIALGVILPIAFAAGIAARKPEAVMASFPLELIASPQVFSIIEKEQVDLFAKTPIRVRLLRASVGSGRLAVSFSAPKDFVKPDLIVYWVAGEPRMADKLPDDALLLGAFNAKAALPLAANAATGKGVLVLYSLADQEIVEVSKPFTFRKP